MAVFKKHLKKKRIAKHGIGVGRGKMTIRLRTRMVKAPTISSATALSIGATNLRTESLMSSRKNLMYVLMLTVRMKEVMTYHRSMITC
jgi:hypothetical protein